MNDVANKFWTLMRELLQATEQGKIAWEETADESQFRALLKPGTVRIGRHVFEDEYGESQTTFNITLLSREGRVVEEFWTPETSQEEMASLYELARRKARKGEQLLNEFLLDLQNRLVKS